MANTFKNAAGAVGVSPTTIYTCPVATAAVLHAVYISNIDGTNDAVVDVEVYDNSAASSFKIGYQFPLPADSTLVLDKPINLEASDELRITADNTGDVEAFVSVLEIT